MAENSKIEWTDHTFNPWEGCQKVGPGCDHCYAEARNARYAGGDAVNWGPGAPRRRTSATNWRKPLAWNRNAGEFYAKYQRRQRVFCSSLADVFDNQVEDEWRRDLATLITMTTNLDWLLLTKRIGNAASMLADMFPAGVPEHVWVGATIVNQEEADRDIPKLLTMPAAARFLSLEPLLAHVDLTQYLGRGHGPDHLFSDRLGIEGRLHWVIVGGESGLGARPMHPAWPRALRDQCQAAGVPFLFKQWGEWAPADDHPPLPYTKPHPEARFFIDSDERGNQRRGPEVVRVGKKAAGRLLDGREWNEVPA